MWPVLPQRTAVAGERCRAAATVSVVRAVPVGGGVAIGMTQRYTAGEPSILLVQLRAVANVRASQAGGAGDHRGGALRTASGPVLSGGSVGCG